MGGERVDVGVDLVEVEEIRVLLVRDDLEPQRAGFVREESSAVLRATFTKSSRCAGWTVNDTRNWYMAAASLDRSVHSLN